MVHGFMFIVAGNTICRHALQIAKETCNKGEEKIGLGTSNYMNNTKEEKKCTSNYQKNTKEEKKKWTRDIKLPEDQVRALYSSLL